MKPSSPQLLSTVFFFIAIFHTFLVSKIEKIAHRFPGNSTKRYILHMLSEVEIVFGFWSFIFLFLFVIDSGRLPVLAYVESLNFTEPLFVFVIMCLAATAPVLSLAEKIIFRTSELLPFSQKISFYAATLVIGPLLGSLITEPAAMTVTALLLLNSLFKNPVSQRLKYATLALLFVNISIGGTLSHFAAPPVLMVAHKWGWDTPFMISHFGYKAVIAILISTALFCLYFRKELEGLSLKKTAKENPPAWKTIVHLIFLFMVVYSSHHPVVFIGIFILFLGTKALQEKQQEKEQEKLRLKQSLLVGIFLAGLVVLGTMQAWWIKPVLERMSALFLFFGSTALTAITDNAALTYLGSLAELDQNSKYALVAGSVAGGGLTVIANAPNPVAFGILRESFGEKGIAPFRLFLWALVPTAIAVFCFLTLP